MGQGHGAIERFISFRGGGPVLPKQTNQPQKYYKGHPQHMYLSRAFIEGFLVHAVGNTNKLYSHAASNGQSQNCVI
jgi:hypothetical protein